MPYSLLTCAGWEAKAASYVGASGCIKSRLGLVFLFFIIAIIRKWGGEEIGLSFSFILGCIGALLPYLLIVTFTGSFKFAMVIGLLGGLAGGYLGGMVLGGGDSE